MSDRRLVAQTAPLTGNRPHGPRARRFQVALAYGASVLGVALVTVVIAWLPGAARIGNISLLYLLAVIATGLRFGSGPAMVSAVLAFLAFDFFFVNPILTFTVDDPSEWLALVMFLLTAAVTGHLTAQLQARANQAKRREQEAEALAETSWMIASQVGAEQSLAAVLRRLTALVGSPVAAIIVRDGSGALKQLACTGSCTVDWGEALARQAVDYVLDQGRPIAWDLDRHHWDKVLAQAGKADAVYVPLPVEHRTLGVLYLEVPPAQRASSSTRRLVESLANHAAVILERQRLATMENQAQALSEADRLKTALLSMVSHDFRSPLASIKASAASLLSAGPALDHATQRDLLGGVIHETDRLNRMVGNILALSRLDGDAWRPQGEPTPAAEVIEAALEPFSAADNRRITVVIAPDLPEVWLDPVQMARVLHNLVENALKYADAPTPITITVRAEADSVQIDVLDRGPGILPGEEERVFERFYRAPHLQESAVPGLGIGLAICRGLVEAHGGTLTAHNRDGGGAQLRLSLPQSPKPRPVPPTKETTP